MGAQEYVASESPWPRTQYPGTQYPQSPQHLAVHAYSGFASPGSSAPHSAPSVSPRAAAMTMAGPLVTGRGSHSSWGPAGTTAPGVSGIGRATSARSPAVASNVNGVTGGALLTAGAWGGGGAAGSGAGGGGGGGGGGAAGVMASLREAFLAATGPQRPVPHVAPYSLHGTADDATSWTSKYLRGNDGLRELVNTLLELAFVAPHSALNGGKSHLVISVACTHGREASLVGNKDDQMRNKLLELRVRGALGWNFELTLRPSSDMALWDKYGGVAAAVQDNWFVLGAVLKDQFGVVLEEDASSRPACTACRRTCLAVTLNKIY